MIYKVSKIFIYFIYRIFWRMQTSGLENIPKTGAFIVAANHRSLLDPPLIGSSLSRPVHFLAKQSLFKNPLFAWFIRQLNAHPISRTGGAGAFKVAYRILKQGGGIAVFPEGTRSPTDELGRAKPGVGLLSFKSKAPVIPAYIHNSAHTAKFKKIYICFGRPIHSDSFEDYGELSTAIMEEIKSLKDSILRIEN